MHSIAVKVYHGCKCGAGMPRVQVWHTVDAIVVNVCQRCHCDEGVLWMQKWWRPDPSCWHTMDVLRKKQFLHHGSNLSLIAIHVMWYPTGHAIDAIVPRVRLPVMAMVQLLHAQDSDPLFRRSVPDILCQNIPRVRLVLFQLHCDVHQEFFPQQNKRKKSLWCGWYPFQRHTVATRNKVEKEKKGRERKAGGQAGSKNCEHRYGCK
eukprot:1159261-Pelagomonas_calceolata.AAC.2